MPILTPHSCWSDGLQRIHLARGFQGSCYPNPQITFRPFRPAGECVVLFGRYTRKSGPISCKSPPYLTNTFPTTKSRDDRVIVCIILKVKPAQSGFLIPLVYSWHSFFSGNLGASTNSTLVLYFFMLPERHHLESATQNGEEIPLSLVLLSILFWIPSKRSVLYKPVLKPPIRPIDW